MALCLHSGFDLNNCCTVVISMISLFLLVLN